MTLGRRGFDARMIKVTPFSCSIYLYTYTDKYVEQCPHEASNSRDSVESMYALKLA